MTEIEIPMVDLKRQYQRMKPEIDEAVLACIGSARFIQGPAVKIFQESLGEYLSVSHVIPCANGTDALQIILMSLDLQPGDEVIIPAFTFVATAEVIALLGLKPVMVDVDPHTFNISTAHIEAAISPKTRAIVPVHLFGQCANMESILKLAKKYDLWVVEDNAQAIGAEFISSNDRKSMAGTMGIAGSTSFFPSKNLGCYGDGGAILTNDDELAKKMSTIANHGQSRRYYHALVGINSRLDSLQAAILNVKLQYLDEFTVARQRAADYYDLAFAGVEEIEIPRRITSSTHVFHQYTIQVDRKHRDALQNHLADIGIASMIYYPVPLYRQKAFVAYSPDEFSLPVTEKLCSSVLSLPMHTELTEENLEYITSGVCDYFKKNN